MNVLIVLLAFFLAFLIFLVFTPITLKIDTYGKAYYILIWGVVKCSLVWQDSLLLEIRLPLYRFRIDLLTAGKRRQKGEQQQHISDKKKRVRKERKQEEASRRLKRGWRLLKTFEVKALRLDLDTSDIIKNAYLYPLFYFMSSEKIRLKINYEGQLGFYLHLENRGVRMIRALISN